MHASEIFRWVGTLVFGAFGGWLIFLNFKIVYVWLVRKKHHSWIPLVGGFLAFFGMGLCPLPQVQRLAWIPLAVDVSYCVLALGIGILMVCFARRRSDDT